MLDMEDNSSEYSEQTMTWDLNIKLMNTDNELQ